MGVLDRAVATALRLITKYGEACVWNQAATPVIANAAQPWIKTTGEPTPNNVRILYTSDSSNAFAKLLAGSIVEAGQNTAIMPAYNFTPADTDTVVRSDGTKLALESIRPVAPNGQVILWHLVFKS